MELPSFAVEKCPLCGKAHEYPLEIITHQMFGREVLGMAQIRTFTLVLTCPDKNTQFQAKIELTETPNARIVSVMPRQPH